MSNEKWQQYAIMPKSMVPVTTLYEKSPEDALVAFATGMDTDMGQYFKAVPEKLAHTGAAVEPNTWLEAVITTYSYDSPTVSFHYSQESAIQYIKDSMSKELQIDIDNGHTNSELVEMEDELFGMKLTTHQIDHDDVMCMILAQSVCVERDSQPAQPEEDKFPQMARWKKKVLYLTADEFDDICVKLYGPSVATHYDMDGLWIEAGEESNVFDHDPPLNEDLSKYFGLKVTSVHIDDCDYVGVWIVYEEG